MELFVTPIDQFLNRKSLNLRAEIEKKKPDDFLGVSENDYSLYLKNKYMITPVDLKIDDRFISKKEDVKIEQINHLFGNTYMADGIRIVISIPYTGESELFECRPNPFSMYDPIGDYEVNNDELCLEYECTLQYTNNLQLDIERDIKYFQSQLSVINKAVTAYNHSLSKMVCSFIEQRKSTLHQSMNIVSSLGIPIKVNDSPKHKLDIKKVKGLVVEPSSKGKYIPEPEIDEKQYQDIISCIRNMSLTMERSPSTFYSTDEEGIRTILLVHLNDMFNGNATAETFNNQGKTDILITYEGKCVFIAECKFWKGNAAFLASIDQLLGYLTWRNTKAALLIFNKNKNFTNVISSMREAVIEHKNYKRTITTKAESESRYIFGLPQDSNREIIITILAFDIPRLD